MARNIEIKARVRDRGRLDAVLAGLTIRQRQQLAQFDTFFQVASGRLKLRQFGDGTAELIRYDRDDRPGARLSTYERVAVQDGDGLCAMLTAALGVRGCVKKHRTVLMVASTRIHLDEVEGLGSFLEIEVVLDEAEETSAGHARMALLLEQLDIRAEDFIPIAYVDLLPPA
jgi:predicted adenylyl cyclase CyaB